MYGSCDDVKMMDIINGNAEDHRHMLISPCSLAKRMCVRG